MKFSKLKTQMLSQETKVKLIIQHSCAESTKVNTIFDFIFQQYFVDILIESFDHFYQ